MENSSSSHQLNFVEKILLWMLNGVVAIFNLIPLNIRITFFVLIFKLVIFLKPKYKSICRKNLSQVFPDKSEAFKDEIYRKSIWSAARLFTDLIRISSLDENKFRNLFTESSLEDLKALREKITPKNCIFLTGHLGSFEYASFILSVCGFTPISIVARQLKQRWVEEWILRSRRWLNVKIINRDGAYKRILRALKTGECVGLAFDQNVTRNHAIFVDFFGRPAATTFAPASAALDNRSNIVMVGVRYTGNGKYCFDTEVCECSDIYDNDALPKEEKVQQITQRLTKVFEKFLLMQPEGWFWMHRRWKTTPEGVEENFY